MPDMNRANRSHGSISGSLLLSLCRLPHWERPRCRDVGTPVAVAVHAGAHWPDRARAAALALTGADDNGQTSTRPRLLTETVVTDAVTFQDVPCARRLCAGRPPHPNAGNRSPAHHPSADLRSPWPLRSVL